MGRVKNRYVVIALMSFLLGFVVSEFSLCGSFSCQARKVSVVPDDLVLLLRENAELNERLDEVMRSTGDASSGARAEATLSVCEKGDTVAAIRVESDASAVGQAGSMQTEVAESFDEWVEASTASDPGFVLGTFMAGQFEVEAVDSAWAISREQELYAFFESDKRLDQYAIESTECKATQCRLSLNAYDVSQANEIIENFSVVMADSDGYLMSVSDIDPESGSVIIYLARNAEGFGFQ